MGAELDADPRLLAAARAALGLAPEEEPELSGKRLVRLLLDREEAARARKNPIHRDDAFVCLFCGAEVGPGGAMVRDHCPRCLRGRHVDIVPGDRAAGCQGLLVPEKLELRAGVVLIHHRCAACGHAFLVRAHPEDRVPPSLNVADLPGPRP